MKKRFKIITTVASLCLAVALMAFGVYAATNAKLGITSKLSFHAEDVKIRYYWSVVGTDTPVSGANTAFSGENIGSEANVESGRDAGSVDLGVEAYQGVDNQQENVVLGGTNGYNFGKKDGSTITYKITVENYGAYPVAIAVAFAQTDAETPADIKYASKASEVTVSYGQSVGDTKALAESAAATAASTSTATWSNVASLAKDKFYTFYVQLALVNVTHDVDEQSLNVTFTANRAS